LAAVFYPETLGYVTHPSHGARNSQHLLEIFCLFQDFTFPKEGEHTEAQKDA